MRVVQVAFCPPTPGECSVVVLKQMLGNMGPPWYQGILTFPVVVAGQCIHSCINAV